MSNAASWPQAGHTLTLIGQQNPNAEHIKTLHDGYLTDLVQAIMEGTVPDREKVREFYGLGPLIPDIFDLEIDYDLGLPGMITACGCDYNNPNITPKNFPLVGKGKVVLQGKLFHFGVDISTPDAEKGITSADATNPWELGGLAPLLAFGKKYPDAQRKFPIIGLGSAEVLGKLRFVPSLDKDVSRRRRLGLDVSDFVWRPRCRFLCVRKKLFVPRS